MFTGGKKSRHRLLRDELNGAAISWIEEGVNVTEGRAFNGSPTLYLRLKAANGLVQPGLSRDDQKYRGVSRCVSEGSLRISSDLSWHIHQRHRLSRALCSPAFSIFRVLRGESETVHRRLRKISQQESGVLRV